MDKHIQDLSKRCRGCGIYTGTTILRSANIKNNPTKFGAIFSNDTLEIHPPLKFCPNCKTNILKLNNLRWPKIEEFLLKFKLF